MDDASATDRWREDRTSFQRIYDVLVGSQTFLTAQEFANRADCSETAARNALEQLSDPYSAPLRSKSLDYCIIALNDRAPGARSVKSVREFLFAVE